VITQKTLVAYVMAADPAFLESSILSYYDQVEAIIVTYDRDHLGWTGNPVRTQYCLDAISRLDKDSKCVYFAGEYARKEFFGDPNKNETHQRNQSIAIARQYSDWIVQIDTDEVLPPALRLRDLVDLADSNGCSSVWFPMLWVFSINSNGITVASNRRLIPIADFPGPILLRADQHVVFSRQEVDRAKALSIRCKNILGSVDGTKIVDMNLELTDLVMHYSMERTESDFQMKAKNNGHAFEVDWVLAYRCWKLAKSRPILASIISVFRKRNPSNKFTHLKYLSGFGYDAKL
jgi:hypothetical protein